MPGPSLSQPLVLPPRVLLHLTLLFSQESNLRRIRILLNSWNSAFEMIYSPSICHSPTFTKICAEERHALQEHSLQWLNQDGLVVNESVLQFRIGDLWLYRSGEAKYCGPAFTNTYSTIHGFWKTPISAAVLSRISATD